MVQVSASLDDDDEVEIEIIVDVETIDDETEPIVLVQLDVRQLLVEADDEVETLMLNDEIELDEFL